MSFHRRHIIAAACVLACGAAPRAAPPQARPLELNRAVEVTLDAGAVPHVYEFPAQAGQFVQVLIDRSSLMFDARLLAPDRSELAVLDNADGDEEARSLSAIAAATGTYRVQIGRYRTSGGSYRVAVATVRAALPDDAKRVEADRAYGEGGRLRVQATADSFKQAITQYDVALGLWRELGDRRNEALTLLQAGGARYLLGDSRSALDLFEQSLTMWRAIDDRIKVAAALSNAAVCLNNLGEPARALAYYSEALPLFQSADHRTAEANTLSNIGRVHSDLGEHQQALDYYERALPIWALSDDSRQPNTLANIGLEHWTLGQPSLARTYLEQALALFRKQGDNNGVALVLNNLGLVIKSDEPMGARELFDQALTLRRAGGDRRAEAAILQNLGSSYADEGRHDRARDYFAQALALRRTTGDRTGEASTLAQLGALDVDAGDASSGLAPLTESLKIADAIGNGQARAAALYQLARLYRASGRLADALERVEAALKWSESVRAGVLSPDLRASFFSTVRSQYDLLIDVLMRLHRERPDGGFDARALEASERARARSMLDLLTEAQVDIRQGVDPALLERERQAGALVTAKTERRMRLASGPSNPTELAAADREIDLAASELRAVEDTLRTRSPHYAALTRPQPLSVADMQARALDDRSALLEYSLGADRSVLWVVTRGSLTSYELPPRAEVDRVARLAYRALTTVGSPDSSALRALSELILAPALPRLGARRLLVVADGALQYVPLAALPARDGSPLALAHEIVSLPSASTLVLLRSETAGRHEAPESVAILADPVFDPKDSRVTGGMPVPAPRPSDEDDSLERSARDFQFGGFDRLASTRSEAETIAALGGAGHVLEAVDFEASIATVKSGQLERYRIVHFATHGLVNSQHPGLSGLVLSLVDEQGRPTHGFLQAHEIYNLRLGADLVVLSACQTALGADVRGEGLIGLTRAFMYAGAPRVVASLWSVPDRATAALMKAFYRRILIDRMSVASALRAAQLELRRNPRWAHPYYWAGFVVQGEPQ